jgi:UDP-N-acetylglucosamine 2-epimerase (non-hydrolysing)
VTGHRRESFGEAFEALCRGILGVADRFPNVGIMYPVHLNPNVLAPVRRILGGHDRICLTSPVSYEEFIALMARSHFILTDSGGVQEEAPSLGKPVLVMRETTERPEGIESGTCKLVGTDEERIIAECSKLLNDPDDYSRRSVLRNPFGDGTAASKIARTLSQWEKCKT